MLSFSLLKATVQANASVVGDIWDLVTDPVKLRASSKEVSNSIERILQELPRLEQTANYDVKQRLDQIRSIAEFAISGANGAIDKANEDISRLEKQVDRDAIDLIYRAQCLSANVDDELQRAMSKALQQLKDAEPNIIILGTPVVRFKVKSDGLRSPDQIYKETKNGLIANLESVKDDTPASKIYWTYQNLEMLARWTKCRYLDQDAAESFTSEMDEMERLSIPWTKTVNVRTF